MNGLRKLACIAVFALGAQAANAVPITLNFDKDLNGNTLVDGTLLNAAYAGLGVTFNTTARIVTGGGGVTSQPNFATGGASFDTNLVLTFDNYALSIGAANVTSSSWTLRAYDAASVLIGTASSVNFPGISSLTGIGQIKRAVFSTTSQYGIDDLSFDAVTVRVPEPGSLILLSAGLLALGFSRRFARK